MPSQMINPEAKVKERRLLGLVRNEFFRVSGRNGGLYFAFKRGDSILHFEVLTDWTISDKVVTFPENSYPGCCVDIVDVGIQNGPQLRWSSGGLVYV